ncbi:MAG: ATP-dependent DNA helicase RecG [Spirochaetaceae bacterium]|nr:MAG: ATP-dependent DNA helicase RecG [Spirochaetaceae bacterium]
MDVTELPGIGKRRAQQLARLGILTAEDLLQHAPRRYEDRSRLSTLVEAVRRGEGLVEATVVQHDTFPRGREQVLKIIVRDSSSTAALVCFGRSVLARMFPLGTEVRVWGQFSLRHGEIQSSLFEAERLPAPPPPLPGFVPVYPLTEGITQQLLRNAVASALERVLPGMEEDLPPTVRNGENLPSRQDAIRALHKPAGLEEAELARRRLVFGELFHFQMDLARAALARRRARHRPRKPPSRSVVEPVRRALPFALTADQERVLGEILADCDEPWPMARLLQGDVGSGKTVVALLAACAAVERGEQVAIMVPTELLARQHASGASRLLAAGDVRMALLLGELGAAQRRELAAAIGDGSVDLVVGTHALFSEGYRYQNLGLVIIDEQHRFGVRQREELLAKADVPDVLMMSATPIPRSLALTAFGDMEISTIRELPPGRQPVTTHLARIGNEERVYTFVREKLAEGRQAYLVYPAIEEGGARELRSVTGMMEELVPRLAPHSVGFVHSRLSEEARNETMERFAAGGLDALVATSVVEVGVDVPNATVMVIEQAELFGLAALHQLRGRVGRGEHQSWCILVYQEPLSEDARERLKVLYRSTDGFFIAEEDLRIRGPGDMPGVQDSVKQAGFLSFRFADIRRDMPTMLAAREAVRRELEREQERKP